MYNAGIDIGSTTTKIIITDKTNNVVFSEYLRHNTEVYQSLESTLQKLLTELGDIAIKPSVTGSVGMGVSEKLEIPFIQEVIASSEAIMKLYPETGIFIDIGGEDSKLLYFKNNGHPDIRMNGNCAGGTGSFIDQMAQLLDVSLEELDNLAVQGKQINPIASRCGVFAKTDIQNLLSKQVPVSDIALSIFNAVAVQTVSTLLQGLDVKPKIILAGGPLVYMKSLRLALRNVLGVASDEIIIPEYGKVFPALGAALSNGFPKPQMSVSELIRLIQNRKPVENKHDAAKLKPLFSNPAEFREWEISKQSKISLRGDFAILKNEKLFLGIDAGSTTTKLVAVNKNKEILFSFYSSNKGNPVKAVKNALQGLDHFLRENNSKAEIQYSVVTGYGEELIRTAFGFDEGMVETIAHYKAAAYFNPEVSFILDIGGQDIKAIFLKDGHITDIQINEACSSGCGTFIETFAESLGLTVQEFAQKACMAKSPYELGSRCTVFMNSKLKQAMREGAGVDDISAGLAYSVIKNCFNKVLNISDQDRLGDNIVVQGGTFLNSAVLRAMELLLGKDITRPEISELMGAWGCALTAIKQAEKTRQEKSTFIGFNELNKADTISTEVITCTGCGNKCQVNEIHFSGGNRYYTGNRCEKIYSNQKKQVTKGSNLYKIKYDLLFKQKPKKISKPIFRIGIPRVLNMYDNYPFWSALFSELNIEVCLSAPSTNINIQSGCRTIMSDNICFPAKLAHPHILDLIDKKVDRIFYPLVRYEEKEFNNAVNSYNCPVVTGYPDVIRNVLNPEEQGIPYDTPTVVFNDDRLLAKACFEYLKQFGIDKASFKKAFQIAKVKQESFKVTVRTNGQEIVKQAKENNRQVIMLTGRPYHIDPSINHSIPEIICDIGIDVISEDAAPPDFISDFTKDVKVISQWQYSNRLYNAVEWTGSQDNVQVVQLNSFGCGPDAVVMDEVKTILELYDKPYTLIRIDEGNSMTSVKLRIRSLIEAWKYNQHEETTNGKKPRKALPPYLKADKNKLIIGPNLSQFYALFSESIFFQEGYNFELLPEADRLSVETGLKYVNNDICYPATIMIGDIIKALQSGKYDPNNVVVAMSETGGQCRASNYIPLVKKAILRAGFENIPVVSVSTNPSTINHQPGFKKKFFELLSLCMNTLIYADALLKMYNFLVVREKNKGESKRIYDKYIQFAYQNRRNYVISKSLELLKASVDEFNRVEYHDVALPRVGIVGEIFMKYNPHGNFNTENWLRDHGVEVVTSPMNTFFVESLVDVKFNKNNHVERTGLIELMFHKIIERRVGRYIDKVNGILGGFHHKLTRIPRIDEIEKQARKVVSLIHQYGEGWLLPGEVVMYAEEDVKNVLSLQPFGCIACHLVSKGISKRIKELYPDINILFLDMDADTSEANIHNRLEFFVKNAKNVFERKEEKTSCN